MLPAITASPPKRLTPRRRPALSRPLRELPPAFLCAIRSSPWCLCPSPGLGRDMLLGRRLGALPRRDRRLRRPLLGLGLLALAHLGPGLLGLHLRRGTLGLGLGPGSGPWRARSLAGLRSVSRPRHRARLELGRLA